jgi:protein-S-isoprenylcysteine O-methyltransferase Ste14
VAGDWPALVNIGLLLLFGVQHSVMARPGFKRRLTQILPASWERSTYLLATSLVLLAILLYWQPMGGYLWSVENSLARSGLTTVYYSGWLITILATFMLNHFHLFGLQQSFRQNDPDAGSKEFKTPFFYQLVRHPIQTGVVIAMVASPDMSWGRAVLALGMLTYVAVGLYFEERDLIAEFGETYLDYKRRVPAVLPALFKRKT